MGDLNMIERRRGGSRQNDDSGQRVGGVALSAVFVAALAIASPANAATFSTVFNLGESSGEAPIGALIPDGADGFFGTASSGNGTVYQLSPPTGSNKPWTAKTIYGFKGGTKDGITPWAGVTRDDSTGALYGTTTLGGANDGGIAFQLTPPAKNKTAWTETVIHNFTGLAGASSNPEFGALIRDASGNLYGTTWYGGPNVAGTVFELSPPASGHGAWPFEVLYTFTGGSDGSNPAGGLAFGKSGTLVGTAYQGGIGGRTGPGTIFQLTPPPKGQSAWDFKVLHSFTGTDGAAPIATPLYIASTENFYGTTTEGGIYDTTGTKAHNVHNGVVYELSPPPKGQTAWTYTVLHDFKSSQGSYLEAGVVQDSAGNLFGGAFDGGANNGKGWGTVFEVTPPASKTAPWGFSLLHVIPASESLGDNVSSIMLDSDGTLYGTTEYGGTDAGGTIFAVVP
jgi:uncharacterized repeat protein (TIGR03803 family)